MKTRSKGLKMCMVAAVVTISVLLFTAVVWGNGITVTVNDYPDVTVHNYDPKNPPEGVEFETDDDGNPLPGLAKAVPEYKSSCSVKWDAESETYKINNVTITIDVVSDIYVPQGTAEDSKLMKHEKGHHTLFKWEYDRRIQQKFKTRLDTLLRDWSNSSPNTQQGADAAAAALETKVSEVGNIAYDIAYRQLDQTSWKFDKLTDHGRNIVTADQGITKAKEELTRPGAGTESETPLQSWTGGVGDTSTVSFDSVTGTVAFAGNLIFDNAPVAEDTLIGRAAIEIEPMIWIGKLDNGATWLGDTAIGIRDTVSGEVLAEGLLLEAAWTESTLPGYAGMLQAYLDIPPDWTGCFDNFIDSELLEDLYEASQSETLEAMFWFFADAEVFDSDGLPLDPGADITGSIMLGVVPEPATLVLLALGGLAVLSRRGMK